MKEQVQLYLIETNPERAQSLGADLVQLRQVTVVQNYSDAKARSGGLDAAFVPLMSALEWGVLQPVPPLHQTRVVQTPDYEVACGRPPFAIPGIAIGRAEQFSASATTRMILRESLKAIHRFNSSSPVKLRSIAVASLSLGLEKLSDTDAIALLSEAYLSSVA